MRIFEFKADDYEIHDRPKLDKILVGLCKKIIDEYNPEHPGMVAAAILDDKNRMMEGISTYKNGKWLHAERVAIDRYREKFGEIPEGSIILTTLSPCNEYGTEMADERYGESCTDLINSSPVRKVYAGYSDPSQHNDSNKYTEETTKNPDIQRFCKRMADTFLE